MEMSSTTQPLEALAEVKRLRRRAHERAHGGAWFPAAAIAVLLLASISLYRYPFVSPNSIAAEYPFWAGLPDEQHSPVASYLFWFVGTPLVFALTAVWYQWRARRIGIRVPWRPFVASGLGVLALLAVLAAVPKGDPAALFWVGLLTPLFPVAVAVIALAWAERSWTLVAAGVWIALLTLWLCSAYPLGRLSGWVVQVLDGGEPSLGGQLSLRPGHYLIVMALPLIAFAVTGLVRLARRTLHGGQ